MVFGDVAGREQARIAQGGLHGLGRAFQMDGVIALAAAGPGTGADAGPGVVGIGGDGVEAVAVEAVGEQRAAVRP